MKKILVIMIALMMLLMASCGGGSQPSADAGSEAQIEKSDLPSGSNKSIDGEWFIPAEDGESEETLTIDGDSAVIVIWTAHKGTVNRDDSTITFDDGTVVNYEIIGEKLVLSGDSIATLAFERKPSE